MRMSPCTMQKIWGKDGLKYSIQSFGEKILNRLATEHKLRKALVDNQFLLEYQPILRLADNQVSGFEALIRWVPPDGQSIPPGTFIPISEDLGIINHLGKWILKEACSQLVTWRKKYPVANTYSININVSGVQLLDNKFPQIVEGILKDTAIDPQSVSLEITESAIIKHWDTATVILRELSAIGVKIHLDDFGTGYSSMMFLSQNSL